MWSTAPALPRQLAWHRTPSKPSLGSVEPQRMMWRRFGALSVIWLPRVVAWRGMKVRRPRCRLAANHGVLGAQMFLAEIFGAGRGAPLDDSEASRWYAEANEPRAAWEESGVTVPSTCLRFAEHPGPESAVPPAQADHPISQSHVGFISEPESAPCQHPRLKSRTKPGNCRPLSFGADRRTPCRRGLLRATHAGPLADQGSCTCPATRVTG